MANNEFEVGDGTQPLNKKEEVAVVQVETKKEWSDIEQKAIDQGWDPDYDGPNKRSAEAFVDRGELLGKIKSQSQELRDIKQTLSGLSEHNKRVYQSGYERALNDLRVEKVKAVNDGDGAKVVALDDQIAQTRYALNYIQNQRTSQPEPQGETAEFIDFKTKNPWYEDSKRMKAWAHGAAIEFAKEHSNATEKQVYDHLTKEVKSEFPEKFVKGPPSPDGEGRSSGTRGSSDSKSGSREFDALVARLPEEHARTAKDLVKRGYVTKEKYVLDYKALEG